jgi:hypothetical protein
VTGDVFSKYMVAAREVINYICRCLDYHPQDSSTESHSMTISRRVFTKVSDIGPLTICEGRVLEPQQV